MFGKKDETKERWNKLVKEIAPEDVYKNAESFAAIVLKIVGAAQKFLRKTH